MFFGGVGRADDVATLSNGFARELRHLRDAFAPSSAAASAAQPEPEASGRAHALPAVLVNGGLVNTDAVRSAGLPGVGAFGARTRALARTSECRWAFLEISHFRTVSRGFSMLLLHLVPACCCAASADALCAVVQTALESGLVAAEAEEVCAAPVLSAWHIGQQSRRWQVCATEQSLLYDPRSFGAHGFEVRCSAASALPSRRRALIDAVLVSLCWTDRSLRRAGEGAHPQRPQRRPLLEACRPLVRGRIARLVSCGLTGHALSRIPLPARARLFLQLTYAILTNDVKLDTSHVDAIEVLIRVRSCWPPWHAHMRTRTYAH